MPRIRTIKPEFWSDERLLECSRSARLLFIGTWTFADDKGNLNRSPRQLKARVFPADNVDVEELIQELLAVELLVEYEVEGRKYLHIQNFTKHQVINKPGPPQCPVYDPSCRTTVVVREWDGSDVVALLPKGREGKERKECIKEPPSIPPSGGGGEGDEIQAKDETESKLSEESSKKKLTQTSESDVGSTLTEDATAILLYLNKITGKNYKPVDGTLTEIKARLKEKMDPVNARQVIFDRWRAWGSDEDKREWVNPKTLFRKSNYWRYEGEL